MKLGKKKLIKNDVLVLEVDNAGILLSKKFKWSLLKSEPV